MNRIILVLTMVAATCGSAAAQQPLYDSETGASLFTNLKAFHVGDVITIVIRESSVASSNSNTQTNNKNESSGGPGVGVLGFMDLWQLDLENKYTGDGKTSRKGSLSAEMTAQLVERLPNGHFRLEGKRTIRINGEYETIIVSGIVRGRDISPQNKVLSTTIASANIVYEGHGDVGNASNPGILTKIINWIF